MYIKQPRHKKELSSRKFLEINQYDEDLLQNSQMETISASQSEKTQSNLIYQHEEQSVPTRRRAMGRPNRNVINLSPEKKKNGR